MRGGRREGGVGARVRESREGGGDDVRAREGWRAVVAGGVGVVAADVDGDGDARVGASERGDGTGGDGARRLGAGRRAHGRGVGGARARHGEERLAVTKHRGVGGVGHAGVGAPTSAANADVASAAAASSSASHPRPLCDTAPRVVAVEPSAARTSPTARSSLPKPHCTRRPGPSSGGDMSSARSGVSSRGSSDILRARADRRIAYGTVVARSRRQCRPTTRQSCFVGRRRRTSFGAVRARTRVRATGTPPNPC